MHYNSKTVSPKLRRGPDQVSAYQGKMIIMVGMSISTGILILVNCTVQIHPNSEFLRVYDFRHTLKATGNV